MVTRRQFVESLCALPVLPGVVRPVGRSSPRSGYGALRSLAPGAVRPDGWLATYLDKQATHLSLHIPEVSWPFSGAYWAGEEQYESWWPWEQRGYWIDGALRCALVTGNQELLRVASAPVDYTLRHAFPDGYLGPALIKNGKDPDSKNDNFRWPNNVFFRALMANAEATNDAAIAQALRQHYLSDRRAPYGSPSRNVTNVEPMVWTYERTGDAQLLDLAKRAWAGFLASIEPGDREPGDLHPSRVFANTPINAHGVTYIEKAKLPALLYMHTGDAELLRFALAAQRRIFDHHMLLDGIPSTSEDYRGTTALDCHETCDISDHTWSWGYLLMATGDGIWGDRIERALFNAAFGAIKKDWKAHQYFSGPNQVLATQNSNHAVLKHGDGWMSYRPNGGHEVSCCAGNVHRIFPNYAIRMWMRDVNGGGLAATLYGPSRVKTEVGPGRQAVEIEERTEYPFGEEIHFVVRATGPVSFPLSLRIPGWCANPQLLLNDKPISLPPVQQGFARLKRTFQPGDRITLVLPMRVAASRWPDDGIALEHGPLVYALPIAAQWTPVVAPKWSTPEYADWNATPQTPWNYGLALDESRLDAQVRLQRRPLSEDPWVDPPVSLTVPAWRVEPWQLATSTEHPDQQFTPPLPAAATRSMAGRGEPERLALAPYGSTHLRVGIFPRLTGA